MTRNVSDWMDIIGNTDASNCSDSFAAARAIMKELNIKTSNIKLADMADALVAYARLLDRHGVKP